MTSREYNTLALGSILSMASIASIVASRLKRSRVDSSTFQNSSIGREDNRSPALVLPWMNSLVFRKKKRPSASDAKDKISAASSSLECWNSVPKIADCPRKAFRSSSIRGSRAGTLSTPCVLLAKLANRTTTGSIESIVFIQKP